MLSLMTVLLVCVASVALGSPPDYYEPCPALPPLHNIDWAELAATPEITNALAKVNALLTNASSGLPTGLIASVTLNQQTLWTKGYGNRNVFAHASGPPQGQDLVRIASITKVFTDILLFILRDDGTVSLDDPVTKYLPEFSIQPAGWETEHVITLRELASHTSGLPRETPFPCGSFVAGCNETRALQVLADKMAVLPPHRRFHYSNLGMGVLGRALGHAATKSSTWTPLAYEETVAERILRPLGMHWATFAFNATTDSRRAVGSTRDGKPIQIPTMQSCGFGSPAGCLWASANDISQLMQLFFREDVRRQGKGQTNQILDGSTLAEMLLPTILLADGSSAVGTPMEMKYEGGVWTKGKQGELPGYRSSMTMVPSLKLGIFTSALVSDVDEASVYTIPALDLLVPSVTAAMWRLHKPAPLPPNHDKLVGTYYDGSVVVKVVDGQLVFQLFDEKLKLTSLTWPEGYINHHTNPDTNTNVLRAHPINSTAGCRWLDDGSDQELVYFNMAAGGGVATHLEFMGGKYDRKDN